MANVETTFIRFICFGYNWSLDDKSVSSAEYIELYNGQKLNIIKEAQNDGKKFKLQTRGPKCDNFKWRAFLAEVFLPKGFPSSVTPDYIEYQIWDTLQAFTSCLSSTLATAAILKGAGVGDETATILASAFAWILKDGFGMLGRIVFAWGFGTALDSDAKKWRLVADILNDLAFCIDLTCTHTERSLFMITVCCSSLMRAIVGVAGGGTRMAVIRHQARRQNLADVAAKDGSQETLVGIISLLASLVILPVVDGRSGLIWTLFSLLTTIHLLANYKAVRALQFDIFNQQRLQIVASHFHKNQQILSVYETNRKEHIFCWPSFRRYGCSLLELNDCQSIRSIYDTENNELKAQFGWTIKNNRNYGVVAVHSRSTPRDLLMAAFQLELNILDDSTSIRQEILLDRLKNAGWNTDSHLLAPDEFSFTTN